MCTKSLLSKEEEGDGGTRLGFARVEGKWRLAVRGVRIYPGRSGPEYWDSDVEPIPLAQAARDLRIASVDLLPELITAVEQEAKKALGRVQAAIKVAR